MCAFESVLKSCRSFATGAVKKPRTGVTWFQSTQQSLLAQGYDQSMHSRDFSGAHAGPNHHATFPVDFWCHGAEVPLVP